MRDFGRTNLILRATHEHKHSVCDTRTRVRLPNTLQRARAGDRERRREGARARMKTAGERERMRQGRGRGRWQRPGEERRGGRHEGGSLVNVSPVSPGPERRAGDRRTMATGSIQKHGSCERTPGSVCCSASACKGGHGHTLSHTQGELCTTGISSIAGQ